MKQGLRVFAILILFFALHCTASADEEGYVRGSNYVPVPRFEGCTGRTYTVSLDYPDLQDEYTINLDKIAQDDLEYAWGFRFTDGEHIYEVMTCHFKNGTPVTGDLTLMQTDLWAVHEHNANAIGDAQLSVRGTSLIWTFDVPEEADLSALRITKAFVKMPDNYYCGDTEIDISFAVKMLYLPRCLERIEAEAFLGVDTEAIDIPDSVTDIGSQAFPSGVTLIVGSGTYAENWANKNNYTLVIR